MSETNSSRFTFTVYSPRHGCDDTYRLNIIDEGWDVAHMSIFGPCDHTGEPYLYKNMSQDHIEYPSGPRFEMGTLFEHARDGTLSDEEIQNRLNRLARWVEGVNSVEKPDFN